MDSENGRMTREEYRAQMGLDAEPNAKREKSGDAGARLILLQLIICAAAVGLIFGIRKLSPASFETIKNTYKSAMQYSINAREAWGKIKSAAGFVFEPAGALADSDKDSETSTESLGKGSSELNVKAYRMSFSPYYTTMSAHMPVSGRVQVKTLRPAGSLRLTHQVKLISSFWKMRSRNSRSMRPVILRSIWHTRSAAQACTGGFTSPKAHS